MRQREASLCREAAPANPPATASHAAPGMGRTVFEGGGFYRFTLGRPTISLRAVM